MYSKDHLVLKQVIKNEVQTIIFRKTAFLEFILKFQA